MTVPEAFAIISGGLNLIVLLVAATIKIDVAALKVYMHEKFLSKEDFLHNAPCLLHEDKKR